MLPNVGAGGLALPGRWEVASARDVFLSAHYWRMFEHLHAPPALVVDLGAHCGHFLVLCHLMVMEKFGTDASRRFAIEPQADLLPRLRATLEQCGLAGGTEVVQGVVGTGGEAAALFRAAHSRMDASVFPGPEARTCGTAVPGVDLAALLPPTGMVDVLKVDIEGAEHAFFQEHPDLLARTRLLALELHPVEGSSMDATCALIQAQGLAPCSTPIVKPDGCQMLLFRRP